MTSYNGADAIKKAALPAGIRLLGRWPQPGAVAADYVTDMTSSLNELSGLLWRERDVLDLVVRRLEGGVADWQALMRSIGSLELHRAITAREAALELGVSGDASLEAIARAAPREWSSILAGHARALRALLAEIVRLSEQRERVASGAAGRISGSVVQRSLRDFLSE